MTEFEIELLNEIRLLRKAVEKMVVEDEPPPDEPPKCEHPIETRIGFGWTNGVPDWECGVCGFRTVTNG